MAKSTELIPFSTLTPFLLMAFGIAWGIFVLLVLYPDLIMNLFGEISSHNPLFILAVYAPAISAITIIYFKTGLNGVKGYLSRLFLWRCSLPWIAFLVIGIPLIYIIGAIVKGNFLTTPFPFSTVTAMVSAIGFMLILGPVEEFGWRGFALPLLQRKMAPIWAGVLLGIIWGIWHLPAFLLSGTPQSAWSFTPFLLGSVAVSVIVTPLFNSSGGSILFAALFHFQLNNPLFPDAQPYDMFIFSIVAVFVVWLNRNTMFNKAKGMTHVIPAR